MNIVCTIQARMRSTRLPGKVMLPIMGRPMLELMIERLKRVNQIDAIVVATTSDASCDVIQSLATRLNVGCFRGSEEDVLDRVLGAARAAQADIIVETTGDCPVVDPDVIDQVISAFLSSSVDYCSNVLERTYPRGLDVQVFPLNVLEQVAKLTQDPVDHEHVSLYIYRHPERFRLRNVSSGLSPDAGELRLTVDTPEDFELVTKIYETLYSLKPDFGLADILDLCARNPELPLMNQHVKQKAL
ncbi:MAG: glycosyltransferase family protein [Nitrospira sp.]